MPGNTRIGVWSGPDNSLKFSIGFWARAPRATKRISIFRHSKTKSGGPPTELSRLATSTLLRKLYLAWRNLPYTKSPGALARFSRQRQEIRCDNRTKLWSVSCCANTCKNLRGRPAKRGSLPLRPLLDSGVIDAEYRRRPTCSEDIPRRADGDNDVVLLRYKVNMRQR